MKLNPATSMVSMSTTVSVLIALAHTSAAASFTAADPEIFFAPDAKQLDEFGYAIATDSNRTLIGSPSDSTTDIFTGSAYVFDLSEPSWDSADHLIPSDASVGDQIGQAVAIRANLIVVGAPGSDPQGDFSGSAYVYELENGDWIERAKLTPSDGEPHDRFGISAAVVSENCILIGALEGGSDAQDQGAVYVYTKKQGLWKESQKIVPDNSDHRDWFGRSLASHSNIVVIGAVRSLDDNGLSSGTAHVYKWTGHHLIFVQKLLPIFSLRNFGGAVAVNNGTILVGETGGGGATSGATHVFEQVKDVWTRTDILRPPKTPEQTAFGSSLAIHGTVAIVGTSFDGDIPGLQSGEGYLYALNSQREWILHSRLGPSTKGHADSDLFGSSVALSPSRILIGAPNNDLSGINSGAVYSYPLSRVLCPMDFSNDGTLDIFDIFSFLKSYIAQDPAADWNKSGDLSTEDVFGFIKSFQDGCPLMWLTK